MTRRMIALVGALCVSLYGSALAASTTKHRVDVTAKVKATKKSGTGGVLERRIARVPTARPGSCGGSATLASRPHRDPARRTEPDGEFSAMRCPTATTAAKGHSITRHGHRANPAVPGETASGGRVEVEIDDWESHDPLATPGMRRAIA